MLAFVLAAASAVLFGAMAVAIRASFRPGVDPEAVSLATTAGALAVCLVLAAPFLGGLTWHGVWPFLVAGLVAPGLSQVLFVRAIEAVGASRTAILVGVSPLLSALRPLGGHRERRVGRRRRDRLPRLGDGAHRGPPPR